MSDIITSPDIRWSNGVDNPHVQSLTPSPYPDDRRVIYGDQRVSNQLERRAKSRLRPAICERRPERLFRIEGVVSYGLLAPILRAITDITLSRRAPECYRSTSTPTPVPIRLLTSVSSRFASVEHLQRCAPPSANLLSGCMTAGSS